MKFKSVLIFLFLLVFQISLYSQAATVTTTRQEKGVDYVAYTATFTADSTDTATITFGGFTWADHNDGKTTIRLSSGEATADSIRWTVQVQAKSYSSDTYFTVQTFADTNSVTPFINMFDPATYGYWPYTQILVIGASEAKTAEQDVEVRIIFERDILPIER